MESNNRGFMQWWHDFWAYTTKRCPECFGCGEILGNPVYEDDPYVSMSGCGGGGHVSYPYRETCSVCGGRGRVKVLKKR